MDRIQIVRECLEQKVLKVLRITQALASALSYLLIYSRKAYIFLLETDITISGDIESPALMDLGRMDLIVFRYVAKICLCSTRMALSVAYPVLVFVMGPASLVHQYITRQIILLAAVAPKMESAQIHCLLAVAMDSI
jgi:hypothetical protein